MIQAWVNVPNSYERSLQSQLGAFFQGHELSFSIRGDHYPGEGLNCLAKKVKMVVVLRPPLVC